MHRCDRNTQGAWNSVAYRSCYQLGWRAAESKEVSGGGISKGGEGKGQGGGEGGGGHTRTQTEELRGGGANQGREMRAKVSGWKKMARLM